MNTIFHQACTMTEDRPGSVQTGAATDETLATENAVLIFYREEWQRIIDHKLIEWGRDPGQLEDDDLIPPSPLAIQAACDAAKQLHASGCAEPQRVVPDGDGGIVFERWCGKLSESLEFLRDGVVEHVVCWDHHVLSRKVQR